MDNLFNNSRISRSAEISECGKYRWWLKRSWSLISTHSWEIICFIMLNPSTADGEEDDSTIRRCISFAQDWGFGGLSVRNLFPYRATDPRELLEAENPTGGKRGDSELQIAMTSDKIVAAWGANVPFDRVAEARELLSGRGPIYCLGLNKNGSPRHPLYVPAWKEPTLFNWG